MSDTADFIHAYIAKRAADGWPCPTIQEMADRVGVCYSTVRASLNKLIVAGRLRRTRNAERGWVVVNVRAGAVLRPLRPVEPTAEREKTPAQQASEISRIYANCMARDGVVGRVG